MTGTQTNSNLKKDNTKLIGEQEELINLLSENTLKEVIEVAKFLESVEEKSKFTYNILQPTCGTNAN